MARTKRDASQKRPLLTADPVVVLDVVCIGQQRVQAQKRGRVEVRPYWKSYMQACFSDFLRIYDNGSPFRQFQRILQR